MAAEGDPLRAQNEALFLIRRWLPPRAGLPLGVDNNTFKASHGAQVERAYGEQLAAWLNDPAYAARYGLSLETVNQYLRSDPAIGARFSRPLEGGDPGAEQNALSGGMALRDEAGNPVRDASGRLMVRTFFSIDAEGFIYNTLPGGAPLTTAGRHGSLYAGVNKNTLFPQLVAEIAGRQIQKKLGIGDPDFFKKLRGLDEIFDLEARKTVLGENDQNALAGPEAGLRLYKTLGVMPEDELRRKLAGLASAENPPPAAPSGDAAARETPEQVAQRQRAREERERKNAEDVERYVRLVQTLKGLDDNALRDVLKVNDASRVEGLLSNGSVRPGLSLGGGLSYGAPWRQIDVDMKQGRMWDMVGFGAVYGRLTGEIYNDLRVTTKFTISRDELLNNIKDEGFKQVLGKMNLPDTVDIEQFNRMSTVLYAYQVLKHEGRFDGGTADRLAAMYQGQGSGLNTAERQAVTCSLNGLHTGDKPPFMANPQWDLPLMMHNGKAGESLTQQSISSGKHMRWFEESLKAPVSAPGLEGVQSTITTDQAARTFWALHAGHAANFPREALSNKVSTADRNLLEQRGVHVEAGVRYKELGLDATLALFSDNDAQKAAVVAKMKEIMENETAINNLTRRGYDAEYAQRYKANQQAYIVDGMAKGYVTQPAPPQPVPAGAQDFRRNAQDIGGALPPPPENTPLPTAPQQQAVPPAGRP